MADPAPPPPPPVWPSDEKPVAPEWREDLASSAPPPAAIMQPAVETSLPPPEGQLEASEAPERPPWHCSMPDFSSMGSLLDDYPYAVCGACHALLFLFSILLFFAVWAVGLYAKTDSGAKAGVSLVSIFGVGALIGLSMLLFLKKAEARATTHTIWAASFWWPCLLACLLGVHLTVTVINPGSLRQYRALDTGTTFNGSINDPAAYTGSYRFYYFTDAMFHPGTVYAPQSTVGTYPVPLSNGVTGTCSRYSPKRFCAVPVVPLNFTIGDPIRVWAGCSSVCTSSYYNYNTNTNYGYGVAPSCLALVSGAPSTRGDCFKQWASYSYGQPILGYRHLSFPSSFRHATDDLAQYLTRAPDSLYIRLTSPAHVEAKKKRYRKADILIEALVFGFAYAFWLIFIVFIFACADDD